MTGPTLDVLFRQAVAAIDAGDVESLERILGDHPRIARERLTQPGDWLRDQIGPALDGFFKDPYLLWFLTEDAVRTGRIPPNVGALAWAIIQAARREGSRALQEQLDSTLHFAVCSPVGREDGRQLELIDVLIDAGASLAGAPVQALICYNFAAAEHLLRRGAPLTLPAAVCLGRWDDVARLGPVASTEEKQVALALAALNGKAQGLAALIPFGVEVSAFSSGFYSHATPLHHAVWSGSLDAVRVLVDAGADLTTRDTAEHATPLQWAEYALTLPRHGEPGRQYDEIATYLRGKRSSPGALLAALYEEDQREHASVPPVGTPDYAALRERDRARRSEAEEALERLRREEGLTAEDLYHAAWLFNHGEAPEDARRAHEGAREAAELGYAPARWLAAASYDRWCMYEGRAQKYGTQFVPDGVRYRLWDVDPATTDAERAEWNVPPLDEQQRRAEEMTRREPQPPMELAPAWLKTALDRWADED